MSQSHEPDDTLWEATRTIWSENYAHTKKLEAYQDLLTKKIDALRTTNESTSEVERARLAVAAMIVELHTLNQLLTRKAQEPFAQQIPPLRLVPK
jgi:hypothetical protein